MRSAFDSADHLFRRQEYDRISFQRRLYHDSNIHCSIRDASCRRLQNIHPMNSTELLIEILEFYIFKLKAGKCTQQEAESATKTIVSNMEIDGSISDFAKFFGVSESNVRAVIARKLFAKPKRILLYPFHKFIQIIPESWRKK